MDQNLLDGTPLQAHVQLGEEIMTIGQRGAEEIPADELPANLFGHPPNAPFFYFLKYFSLLERR